MYISMENLYFFSDFDFLTKVREYSYTTKVERFFTLLKDALDMPLTGKPFFTPCLCVCPHLEK